MKIYNPRPREEALEQISAHILQAGLSYNDKLPPERDMCSMWQLNRCTLRSALSRMSDSGLLVSLQGSANRLRFRFKRRPQELISFSEAARREGYVPGARLLSSSSVPCDGHLARNLGLELGEMVYKISRLLLLNGFPIMIETSYIPQKLAPELDEHIQPNNSLYEVLEKSYGLELARGVEKAGLTVLCEQEALLLDQEQGEAAFWLVRHTEDKTGMPIEYSRSVVRADAVEMVSELHWCEESEADSNV